MTLSSVAPASTPSSALSLLPSHPHPHVMYPGLVSKHPPQQRCRAFPLPCDPDMAWGRRRWRADGVLSHPLVTVLYLIIPTTCGRDMYRGISTPASQCACAERGNSKGGGSGYCFTCTCVMSALLLLSFMLVISVPLLHHF